jgi:hypothetical protein
VNRRQTLAVLGAAAVPTAVCLGTGSDEPGRLLGDDAETPDRSTPSDTGSPTDSPLAETPSTSTPTATDAGTDPSGGSAVTGRQVPLPDGTVSVTNPRLFRTRVEVTQPFIMLDDDANVQHLVVDVRADGYDRCNLYVSLEVDGDRVTDSVSPCDREVVDVRGAARVALSVPVAPASSAVIVLDPLSIDRTVRYAVPPDVVQRFDKLPDFEVVDARVADQDGNAAIEATVRNTGERDGFLTTRVINRGLEDAMDLWTIPVPAGVATLDRFVVSGNGPSQVRIVRVGPHRIDWKPV